jgi:hypothetical protein
MYIQITVTWQQSSKQKQYYIYVETDWYSRKRTGIWRRTSTGLVQSWKTNWYRTVEKRAAEKRAAEKRAVEKRATEKRAAEKKAMEKCLIIRKGCRRSIETNHKPVMEAPEG